MSSFRAELFLLMCVSKGRNYANDRILEEWFRNSIFDDKIGLYYIKNIIQLTLHNTISRSNLGVVHQVK